MESNQDKVDRCKELLGEARTIRAKALKLCNDINYSLETKTKAEDDTTFTKADAKSLWEDAQATSIRLQDLAKMLKPLAQNKEE